ncbi:MAG: hypothetical protein PHC61_15845 [Chitinivibrionales bacterium]|nr:hypothetical protein [Chitinivibrionales bacterium]
MLFEYLYQHSGIYLFYSRLFATSMATIFAFFLAMVLFPFYIGMLRRFNFNSELTASEHTVEPVMPAGILFMLIIWLTSLLTVRFNSYVVSALIIYTFFGLIGAIDDLAKVINKRRLAQGKIAKQSYQYKSDGISSNLRLALYILISLAAAVVAYKYIPNINGHITVPFYKGYPYFPSWLFIPCMALTIAVMANGVNFNDGFDTLATIPLITCLLFVGVIAYISSNAVWCRYLLLPHIPNVEEILPLIGAVIGTLLAYLWFNAPPSTIIMGDSGAVALGGMVGIMFVFIKAWLFLPIVGFIFFMEFTSVFLQIGWFKLSKGKRLFLMAPIHHHFQILMRKKPYYKNDFLIKTKIAWRFHIVSVILLVVGLILFLKVR